MQYRTGERLIFLSICLFLLLTKTAAQQTDRYFFQHITYNDGLLHNDVYDIVQDKKGFIWLATAKGLQRYDGNRFLGFNDMLNDPAASRIGHTYLNQDSAGEALWIRKTDDLEKLDLQTNRIRLYHPDEYLAQYLSVCSRYKTQQHMLWLVSDQAAFSYDSLSKKSTLYAFDILPANKLSSAGFITDTPNGESWFCTASNGIVLLDKKTMEIYSMAYNPTGNPLLQALRAGTGPEVLKARAIMKDSRNNLWIATWGNTFYRYNFTKGKLSTYSLATIAQRTTGKLTGNKALGVSGMYEDNHHKLWIGTDNTGLLQYDELADDFKPVVINNNLHESNLSGYNIFCITQDREENIWLGTDKGILLFNPYQQYFNTIHHDDMNAASLPPNEIECYIQTSSGDLLVGTWGGGITVYDSLWKFKKNIGFTNGPAEYNFVWAFAQNDDGSIWAGLQHGYIHIYDPVTQRIKTIHPPEMENSTIRTMAKDSSGNIWMGLHNGKIVQWNKKSSRFVQYKEIVGGTISRLSPVLTIFFDTRQDCWAGTEYGLKLFDTQTGMYTKQYLPDKSNPKAITANSVTAVAQADDSTLIVGTLFGGLNILNTKKQTFKHPVFDDSTKYSNVHAIKRDDNGNCWFTTDYGLFRFKPGDSKTVSYRIEKGILTSAFKNIPFYTCRNGRWVSCTATEIIDFNPGSMLQEILNPGEMVITGVQVFDHDFPVDSLLRLQAPLQLSYKQNFITVEFSKLSFATLHPFNYYYRLKGISDDWINAGKQSSASYNNLGPGSYTFEVREGETNNRTKITSFDIVITPPFWKTWWFISLVSACILFGLYRLVRWRLEAARTKEKLSLAKLEALRSQMNPHFIFNCLSSIDNLIQTGEKSKATTYLAKFARLIRSILETSTMNTVPCWQDMETLALYLEMEALGCDMKFNYTLDIAKEITSGDYRVPPLVIQPFVENAIHHGLLNKREPDKVLKISVTASKEYIRYTIEDNGVGREKAIAYRRLNKSTHRSMGLQISADTINLYNQNDEPPVVITDLYDTNGQACGTKVEVNLINQS